jgi:hypothetical protein
MGLHDTPSGPEAVQRALLATDWRGRTFVLATDGAGIAADVNEVSADAEEIGLIGRKECGAPGLYLWEGTSRLELESWEAVRPTEVVYDGTVRVVRPDEAAALFALTPPEEQPGPCGHCGHALERHGGHGEGRCLDCECPGWE